MFWIKQLDLSHQAWLRRSQPHYWKPGAWGSLSRVAIREGKTRNLFRWGLHTSRHRSSLHTWLPSSAGANTSPSTIRARCLLPSSLCSQDSCSAPPTTKAPHPTPGPGLQGTWSSAPVSPFTDHSLPDSSAAPLPDTAQAPQTRPLILLHVFRRRNQSWGESTREW